MDKNKQQIMTPSYLAQFECIGGTCEDTCCAGWYIAIDDVTYKKYKKVKHPELKKRLDKELVARKGAVTEDHVAKIKLKNGRCAFLSKQNLCDIYSCLGEGYLSHTCTLYPRTINKINECLEYSLAFSCPEAARKILLPTEKMRFEATQELPNKLTISAELKVNNKNPKKWQDYFFELRTLMITLLQNREGNMEQRLQVLDQAMKEIENLVRRNDLKKIPQAIDKYLKPNTMSPKLPLADETSNLQVIAQYLLELSNGKKLASKRYEACLAEVLEGLVLDAKVLEQQHKGQQGVKLQLEPGKEVYAQVVLEQQGHILENYFVNYIFERCIPLDGQTPYESMEKIKLYYLMFKLHLIGLINQKDTLTQEHIVTLIQSFTKVYDHSDDHIPQLMKRVKVYYQ